MVFLFLTFYLLIKGSIVAVFIYYAVKYFSYKNETNNWISAIIIGLSFSFFVGLLRLLGAPLMFIPIIYYPIFPAVYKLGWLPSAFISVIIYVILVVIR